MASNPWVNYIERSYTQIKDALIARFKVLLPEITDYTTSNPLVILVEMVAGVAEMINFYIDNVARETFVYTARRRASLIRHSKGYDYRIKLASPERATVRYSIVDNDGNPTTLPGGSNIIVPAGTVILSDGDNLPYKLEEDAALTDEASSFEFTHFQVEDVINQELGTSTGGPSQEFLLGDSLVADSVAIVVGGTTFSQVRTFANSGPDDNHFIVDVKENSQAYVVFGDGIFGNIPTNEQDVVASYQITLGPDGAINANTLVSAPITFETPGGDPATLPSGYELVVTNPKPSSGGASYESTASIKRNLLNSLRTRLVAVGPGDYAYIASTVAGVAKSNDKYNPETNNIDVTIAAADGGEVDASLLSEVQTALDRYKLINSYPIAIPAGYITVYLGLRVNRKQSTFGPALQALVTSEFQDFFSFYNQDINGAIRISDIYATGELIEGVDYLNIDYMYVIPYVNAVGDAPDLDITFGDNPASTEAHDWVIIVNSQGGYDIYKDGSLVANNTSYAFNFADDDIDIALAANGYSAGDRWSFTSYPYKADIIIRDNTIARLNNSLKVLIA